MILARFISAIVLGYILGSIPFGLLVAKRFTSVDVRQNGSGKIGATNVLRTAGGKAALLVALLDIFKGILAVILAHVIMGDNFLIVGRVAFGTLVVQALAALAAIIGHNWPIFLKFRGGRGVATYFGGLIALCPPAAIFGGEILILGAGLTSFASFGSIAGVISASVIIMPLTIMNGFPLEYLVYTFTGAIIVIIMHRDNIKRLFAGTERQLNFRRK